MSKDVVAVLGASPNPRRYSNRAVSALLRAGHIVIPINPSKPMVHDIQCVASLGEIESGRVDTLTLYLSPERSEPLLEQILQLNPRRVIANPGTESDYLKSGLAKKDITMEEDCTLVMLAEGRFVAD